MTILFLHMADLGYAPFVRDDNFWGEYNLSYLRTIESLILGRTEKNPGSTFIV